MLRKVDVLACCLGIILLPVVASAADWPNFRGPNFDGVSPEGGLLKEWPAGGPTLVWKAKGIGEGYSGVSIVGDRIYTSGDSKDAGYVYALELKDGKQIWATKLGKPGAPGWGGFAGPRATPTVDGDLIFAVDQWGELVCLQREDGKEKWRKSYTADLGGSRPEWGFAESPVVDGNAVLVTPGGDKGAIAALDKKTGAVLWQSSEFTDPAHYSTIVVAKIAGEKQYVQLTERSVAGVSPKDGKVLWKAARKGATAVIPTPIVHDDHVYVTSGYGVGCNLFKITKSGDAFAAEQVYANKVMVNHHGGVVRVGDNIYGFSEGKGWTCQDFKTGEAKWQDKESFGKGAITGADDRFILREEKKGSGNVVLIEVSPEGYKERGRFSQPDRSTKEAWPHPVVAHGKLFLRDQDLLLCYDLKGK